MKRWLPFVNSAPTVSIVRLQGTIAATGRAALNDQSVAQMLHRAFVKGKPAAVALVVNSPGGSPAQSSLIAARIRRLSEDKEVPVFAFVEDVAASGGYWIAAAADEIWVDATSIVGSIGVISASFGFHELMARQGIERRVHTAGKDKSMLDPFRPERPEDVERLMALQTQLHETFKGHVTSRRGAKLPEGRDLFTGEIWVGQQGIDVGLVDGIGHLVPVMKEKFGEKLRFRTYGPRRSLISRFGLTLVEDALDGLEARSLWSRFGL
jgi:serine protease SohB